MLISSQIDHSEFERKFRESLDTIKKTREKHLTSNYTPVSAQVYDVNADIAPVKLKDSEGDPRLEAAKAKFRADWRINKTSGKNGNLPLPNDSSTLKLLYSSTYSYF